MLKKEESDGTSQIDYSSTIRFSTSPNQTSFRLSSVISSYRILLVSAVT